MSKLRFGSKKCFLAAALICGGLAVAISATAAEKPAEQNEGMPRKVRLLTTEQYINTIGYFFGPDVRVDVTFAPLKRTEGLLATGASIAGVSDAQAEIFQKAAALTAELVLSPERRATLLPCKPKSDKKPDDACATKFLRDVMGYLYRSEADQARLKQLVGDAGLAAEKLGDFYGGLQLVLEGVLLSPNLLFVREDLQAKQTGEQKLLDGDSLAARLSLFLWNAAPDPMLRRAAERGSFATEKGRAQIVDQMLASPRLEDGVRAFFDDMFHFNDFGTLSKDASVYPYFVGEALRDSREQTLRTVVEHLIKKDHDYRDLYTTRETFISPSLALVYGIPTPAGWSRIEFPPESHRDGILTQVSFLALHSHPTRTSPTLRGKALREILFCQKVPPPPANVDFSALNNPSAAMKTTRERVSFHLENPVCAGCHKITDPVGLALENFDGAGKFRSLEGGIEIDASGNLDGKNFADATGLAQVVRNHPALPGCLVNRALSYGIGSPIPSSLRSTVGAMSKDFATSGYRLRALLRQIALSPAFLYAYETEDQTAPAQSKAEMGAESAPTANGGKS